MTIDPTKTLLDSVAIGDRRALESLLEQYLPRLRAFVRVRLSPELRAKESTQDITQSVCRELIEGFDRFEWRGEEAFRGWLFTAALRKVADKAERYGTRKRDLAREVTAPASDGEDGTWELVRSLSSPSGHAMAREVATRIERGLAALSDEEREVVTLARIAGLSRAEIGRQIGKSEGAVRIMLHRALVKISEFLEPAD